MKRCSRFAGFNLAYSPSALWVVGYGFIKCFKFQLSCDKVNAPVGLVLHTLGGFRATKSNLRLIQSIYSAFILIFRVSRDQFLNMKKLQVFISSTYSDLLEERQACVETILQAGHILAGMELFAAGSETQLDTIKRWIDASDVYMLLLGGRYGSLDPKTKLAYTEVEYRYALEKKKPVFAVVMSDGFLDAKIAQVGRSVFEQDNVDKYRKLKKLVLSKIVKFFDSLDGIKLAIFQSMIEIDSRYNLEGWVRGSEVVDVKPLISQISVLTQENATLKKEITSLRKNGVKQSKSKRTLKQFELQGNVHTVEH